MDWFARRGTDVANQTARAKASAKKLIAEVGEFRSNVVNNPALARKQVAAVARKTFVDAPVATLRLSSKAIAWPFREIGGGAKIIWNNVGGFFSDMGKIARADDLSRWEKFRTGSKRIVVRSEGNPGRWQRAEQVLTRLPRGTVYTDHVRLVTYGAGISVGVGLYISHLDRNAKKEFEKFEANQMIGSPEFNSYADAGHFGSYIDAMTIWNAYTERVRRWNSSNENYRRRKHGESRILETNLDFLDLGVFGDLSPESLARVRSAVERTNWLEQEDPDRAKIFAALNLEEQDALFLLRQFDMKLHEILTYTEGQWERMKSMLPDDVDLPDKNVLFYNNLFMALESHPEFGVGKARAFPTYKRKILLEAFVPRVKFGSRTNLYWEYAMLKAADVNKPMREAVPGELPILQAFWENYAYIEQQPVNYHNRRRWELQAIAKSVEGRRALMNQRAELARHERTLVEEPAILAELNRRMAEENLEGDPRTELFVKILKSQDRIEDVEMGIPHLKRKIEEGDFVAVRIKRALAIPGFCKDRERCLDRWETVGRTDLWPYTAKWEVIIANKKIVFEDEFDLWELMYSDPTFRIFRDDSLQHLVNDRQLLDEFVDQVVATAEIYKFRGELAWEHNRLYRNVKLPPPMVPSPEVLCVLLGKGGDKRTNEMFYDLRSLIDSELQSNIIVRNFDRCQMAMALTYWNYFDDLENAKKAADPYKAVEKLEQELGAILYGTLDGCLDGTAAILRTEMSGVNFTCPDDQPGGN